MDVLENILERIAETTEQRDVYLKQAEVEEQKIAKLESMYYLLEDPATQELMKDVVVGLAVQNGVAVPNGSAGGAGEKHYVGMQRVREYASKIQAGQSFTVHEIFTLSVEHMPSIVAALQFLPADGYRDFVARGLERLRARIPRAASSFEDAEHA
jgi:hypothetical protein